MHDEEDHAVLANEVNQRHSRRGQRQQNTRDAEQRERHDEQYLPEGTYPEVRLHFVLAM